MADAPIAATRAHADVDRAAETTESDGTPVLVLLHGTRRTRAMWRHQLDGLADSFHPLAVDLPAHGALADVPFSMDGATDLVAAVIEGAARGRAIVVGSSLGGYVGMDLAARRPDLVAGLVLANATAEPRSLARRAPRTVGSYLLVAAGESLRGRPARANGGGNGAEGAVAGGRAGPAASEADEGPATNGWLFKGGTRAMVWALGQSFIPRLAAYPGPTLILNGAEDVLFRRDEHAFLAAAADGRLELIPGTGHLANEEQPAAFNAAIRRFAAEVHARAAAATDGSSQARGSTVATPQAGIEVDATRT
jgi:pimeloyl-ACP methyl ester carboxylesterase